MGRSLPIRYCKNNGFIAPGAKTKEVAQQRISARIPRYHVLRLLTETAALFFIFLCSRGYGVDAESTRYA